MREAIREILADLPGALLTAGSAALFIGFIAVLAMLAGGA